MMFEVAATLKIYKLSVYFANHICTARLKVGDASLWGHTRIHVVNM